ncbi:MAG: hypothetical protein WDO71_08715 [Bacteroidota bacterium]
MRKLIFAFMMLVTVSACTKSESGELTGTIDDFFGRLDGCHYLIQLDNGKRLEPVLNSSGEPLLPGRRIVITYKSKPQPSICMAGETVEITSLRYL